MESKNKRKDLIISLLLGIYLSFVTSPVEWGKIHYLLFVIKCFAFSFSIKFVLKLFFKTNFMTKKENLQRSDYIGIFIYIMIVMCIALFVYYPSNYTIDMNSQYTQAITGQYDDWHPVIHTFFFFRIPTLFIQSKLMCSIFQMIFIDFVLLYFCSFLNRYGFNKKSIIFIISLLVLNPSFDFMAISLLKDVSYSYCLFIATLNLIDICMSDGEWLKRKRNFFMFLFASFGISFFRHNGIFSFVAMMFILFIGYKKIRKKSLYILLIILSLRFIFIPNIYKMSKITKINFTISEMVCVMLNQMLYIYKEGGYITDYQLKELGEFQDLKKVNTYYNPYDYNSIKYPMNYHGKYTYLINTRPKEFFTLWKNMVINNKKMAIKSYLYSTYCMYHIGLDSTKSNTDLYFVAYNGNNYSNIHEEYFAYKKSISNWFFNIFLVTVSTGLFYIIFSLLYCLMYSKNKLKEKLKLVLPYVPVLSNFMLLMFLLPGRETRFIYSNILCAYPLIIYVIILKQKKFNRGGSRESIK